MKRRRHTASDSRDRGSVAVEFALLLPVLLLLIFGVIDFGRAINAQITLTQAAREGARLAALGQSSATVTARAQSAAVGLSPVTVTVTACPPGATQTTEAKVVTRYAFTYVTPISAIATLIGGSGYGSPTLTATGVMPCE